MFLLHVFEVLPIGGYDLSVLNTFVQLIEGRSARNQPKQLPAKKSEHWSSGSSVLHNQNDMVFKASSWVSEAQGAVISREVTTCAGMTAHGNSCTNQNRLPYRRPKS